MQKLFNNPKDVVNESIAGFLKCNREYVAPTKCKRTIKYCLAPVSGKVGVVSGGGSGHDPAFMGYLGKNMLDAVAIGDIFQPPSAKSFYTAFKEADAGKGVVCVYGNYPKDTEQVEIAAELARKDGIDVRTIIVNEDIAGETPAKRRGMTGEVLLWKISGAAAALGYDLDAVVRAAQKALERTRSIGIGLKSCVIPELGQPNYVIEPGTMEIGVGHHGFSSLDTIKIKTADTAADLLLGKIFDDMPFVSGDTAVVMVSGFGGTMMCEMHIFYSRIHDVLAERGIHIHRSYIGNYFTSLDMMGLTLTLMKPDEEMTRLLDHPAYPASLISFA